MSFWKRIKDVFTRGKETASLLMQHHREIKKVVTDAADVWKEYGRAKSDGTITANEYVKIGNAAVVAAQSAHELAVKLGWRE